MIFDVDPRAWNIVAGLALATGCGGRTIASEGGETSTTSDSNTTDETTLGDECVVDSDCPDFYYCLQGICEYVPHSDGSWEYECYTDEDCGELGACASGFCVNSIEPNACNENTTADLIADIPVEGLELSYVEAGPGPGTELVVLAANTLEVYAAGSDEPTSSDHGFDLGSVQDMVVGELDLEAGEDLAILVDAQPQLVSGDGQGGFVPGEPLLPTFASATRLLAVELDGVPPEDLVSIGTGARAQTTNGSIIWDMDEVFSDATGRDVPGEGEGVSFLGESRVWLMGPNGNLATSIILLGGQPSALTSLEWPDMDERMDVFSTGFDGWTALEVFDSEASSAKSWGLPQVVYDIIGGDFSGDGIADLAYVIAGEIYLHRNVPGNSCVETEPLPLPPGGIPRDWDVGDFDGDGDDDLAVLLDDRVLVFDLGTGG